MKSNYTIQGWGKLTRRTVRKSLTVPIFCYIIYFTMRSGSVVKTEYIRTALKICAALCAVCALLLTFTVSDYYIFNLFSEYGVLFCLCQWGKKAGLALIILTAFFESRRCADCVKYILPVFAILSCFLFGDFFDIYPEATTATQEIYNNVNLFMPKWANETLFFTQNGLFIICCALIFLRDGVKIKPFNLTAYLSAFIACTPLNIFENFFDINDIPEDSFLRFGNFTIWHAAAFVALGGVSVCLYLFLKNKDRKKQDQYLAALAVILLIQYHSKDSIVMGDGYNVYHTVLACVPLFICNIGVYTASLTVFLKKKTLYAISFFIHAAGAFTVFCYFGKPEMSNYGIFCSYSILFFSFTHCILFALCIAPVTLGHYKFTLNQCVIPLIYYFVVIVIASVFAALVTSASYGWHTADGIYLEEPLMPNYSFTQINPLPFEVPPVLTITVWKYQINVLYVLGLYVFYMGLFAAFYALYRLFVFVYGKIVSYKKRSARNAGEPAGEVAATSDEDKKTATR